MLADVFFFSSIFYFKPFAVAAFDTICFGMFFFVVILIIIVHKCKKQAIVSLLLVGSHNADLFVSVCLSGFLCFLFSFFQRCFLSCF